jgi:hypothetical protein
MIWNPRTGLWLSAAVALLVGISLVTNGSGAGWLLIIIGIVDVVAASRAARWLRTPDLAQTRWGLVALTMLLILLALMASAAFPAR